MAYVGGFETRFARGQVCGGSEAPRLGRRALVEVERGGPCELRRRRQAHRAIRQRMRNGLEFSDRLSELLSGPRVFAGGGDELSSRRGEIGAHRLTERQLGKQCHQQRRTRRRPGRHYRHAQPKTEADTGHGGPHGDRPNPGGHHRR